MRFSQKARFCENISEAQNYKYKMKQKTIILLFTNLCVGQKIKPRFEEVPHSFVGSFKCERFCKEYNDEDQRNSGCEIPSFCRRFDALPYGEIHQNPSAQ